MMVIQKLKQYYRKNKKHANLPLQIFFIQIVLLSFYVNITVLVNIFPEEVDQKGEIYFCLFIIILIFWTYYLAYTTSPFQENLDNKMKNVNEYSEGDLVDIKKERFKEDCEFCKFKKFERSSHCRVCEQCVLRRDHHCGWLGKCVGFENTRFFINFCFWACFGCAHVFVNYIRYFSMDTKNDPNFDFGFAMSFFFYWNFFMMIFVILLTSGIFKKQLDMVFNDLTYLETMKNPGLEDYCCVNKFVSDRKQHNNYNKGFLFNFYYIVGPTFLHIIFPLPKAKRYDNFAVNPAFDKTPLPSGFDLYKFYQKVGDNEKVQAMHSTLESTSPEIFVQMSEKYYHDKIIQ